MAKQAVNDPRRERQEFLLGVLRTGTDEDRLRALKELDFIGDVGAGNEIRELADGARDITVQRLLRTTERRLLERRKYGEAKTADSVPEPPAGYLPGNFADLRLPAPPPYDPNADRVTRDRARALDYLTSDDVEHRVTGLAVLMCIGDNTHLLAVCHALMDSEPEVQHAAREAYEKIIERLQTGAPLTLPELPGDQPVPTPENHRQQLLRRVTKMVREDQQTREDFSLGAEHVPSTLEVIGKAMTNSTPPPPPPPDDPARLKRQGELLSLLASGNEPTQWIAIKELAKIGGPEAADQVFAFMHSENRDVAEAARLAYRQMKERELLGAVVTPDDHSTPPEGTPDAPQLEDQYLAEQAPPPVAQPAEPLPPPIAADVPLPPPPPRVVEAPQPLQDGLGLTQPDVANGPLPAPTTDVHEAALLPAEDDLGLLPQ